MDVNSSETPFIYLDYNATTPLAPEVIKGIRDSLVSDWGNPSSGHSYGFKASSAIHKARDQLAKMVNCSLGEVIFTSGGTESNNMVINSAIQYYEEYKYINGIKSSEKPHIITTNVEHDSVILPIKQLEKSSKATCSIVEVNNKGCIDVNEVLSKIAGNTCLITVMHANNETGVIMPIREIGHRLSQINAERKERNQVEILYHTDAAQIIGKEKIDFRSSKVDYMTIVGHKFYGPRIGCICAKVPIHPMLFGGGQEKGLRPGTENTPMIVGLGIAAELVSLNVLTYQQNMRKCRDRLEARLIEVFGDEIVINCKESARLPNTSSISFRGVDLQGNEVLGHCGRLIASVGAACHGGKCSQVLLNSGVSLELAKNSIRLSVGRNTSFQDVEDVVSDLKEAVRKVRRLDGGWTEGKKRDLNEEPKIYDDCSVTVKKHKASGQ